MSGFGKRLRALREEAHLSLKVLADRLGWSVVYLADIERGRRNPPAVEKIVEIAGILNCPVNELLNLADQDRNKVELELGQKSPAITEAALMLARSWDGLTDSEAEEIMSILKIKGKAA